jgi:hypothetical protein
MLVERVNHYLTKGLKIMSNEWDSVRIASEAIHWVLYYVWNSCSVPGTDISCSLVAIGCEFAFPIDYSRGKHWELRLWLLSTNHRQMEKLKTVIVIFSFAHRLKCICGEKKWFLSTAGQINIKKLPFFYL